MKLTFSYEEFEHLCKIADNSEYSPASYVRKLVKDDMKKDQKTDQKVSENDRK